jgi:hypothetical protein
MSKIMHLQHFLIRTFFEIPDFPATNSDGSFPPRLYLSNTAGCPVVRCGLWLHVFVALFVVEQPLNP